MVAFNSSRRQRSQCSAPKHATVESLEACQREEPLRSAVEAGGSRRFAAAVETFRGGRGEITEVRIGRWRVLTSAPQRRIAEVRQLAGERVAVRIERFIDGGRHHSSEIWQLYDGEGRLEAALQTTPDGKFAMLTNYRTRQGCRLVRNRQGELETVETWSL